MADDIQSNIRINIDTASAMDSIRLLQSQISAFHQQMSKMGAASVADSRNMQQNLINSINSTGQFAANITKIRTTAEQFSYSLERNKLSMGEYFRYAGGATKTFGKLFASEFDTINKVARERVKDLQSQYIKLGRDANGAMQAIKVRPLTLDMNNLATKTQIAAQRQQLLNQLLKQGSTNLLNFGKNTQWAGRQLMVGFTIPLSIMGGAAMKAYKEIEEASLRLKRVYGDFGTTAVETEKMVKQVQSLALEYTKYGIAVKDSMDVAATAAATGKKGADLLAQIASANKLAVLGGVDQQKALQTTISLTDAFSISAKDLGKNINFLNAVENQTVLSIEDMTTAIPKAAPVIQQLGGDVKDLAFFLTAMKEGGINASEGANAIKSGLASIINPTNTASKMLQGFGINLRGIVEANKGDVKKTVVDFAQALDKLDPINRAKAIEQLFGKFQFARMSTLFKNVIEQGSQASEVLKLANQSSLELSMLAQRELSKVEQSPLYKFQKAIADFQAQLAPVGEQFMKAITPIINFGADVLKQFNGLGEGVKGFIVKFVAVAGVVGPVLLMSFGLIANAVANVIKGFALVKDIFNKTGKSSMSLGDQVNYMTQEQIQASAIASSLDQVHSKLKQTFTSEAAAVDMLTGAYERSIVAQRGFAMPVTPRGPVAPMPRKYAAGGIISGPGTGTSDSILAMVSNGEAIIPAASVARNPAMVRQLVAGNIPGFVLGTPGLNIAGQGYTSVRGHLTKERMLGDEGFSDIVSRSAFSPVLGELGQYIKVVSNLVAEIPQSLNILLQEKMGRDGIIRSTGASPEQFSQMFNQRQGKLLLSAKLGGYDIDSPDAMKQSMELEKQIHDRALVLAQGTEKQRVTDSLLAKATRKVVDEAMAAGGELRQFATALDASSKQVGQIRLSVPSNVVREGLQSGKFTQNELGHVLHNGVQIARVSQSDKNLGKIRPASAIKPTGSYNVAALRSISAAEVEQTISNDILAARQAVVSGVKKSTKQKSPSKDAFDAGSNIGRGAIQGIQSQTDDAKNAGTQVGMAATQGITQSRRVRTQGESFTPGNMVILDASGRPIAGSQAQRAEDAMATGYSGVPYGPQPATKFQQSRLGKVSTKYNNFFTSAGTNVSKMDPQKFQGRMFGASMGLGVASMVLPGEAGQAAGIASMFTGFAGMFKNLGPVVGKLIPLFGKLIPFVGIAVTAFEVFDKVIMPLIKKNSESYAAITETLKITQDKLTKINNFFGTEIKASGIRGAVVASGDQTAKQASIAQQFQKSQEFKDTYQASAQKMTNLSDAEFKLAMQGYAMDLFGQGMEKEQVTAIVDAIAIEAKKTRVSIVPELFSLNNPETKQLMSKNVKAILSDSSKLIKDLQQQTEMSGGIADSENISAALRGEYDNKLFGPIFADLETIEKLKAKASELGSYMSALSGQYANGAISAREYNIQFEKLLSLASETPGTEGLELIKAAISSIDAGTGAAIANLERLQLLAVSTAIFGGVTATEESRYVLAYGTEEDKQKQADLFTKRLKDKQENEKLIGIEEKKIKGVQSQTENLANTEQKVNDKYDKRIAQIEKIKKLNDQIAKSQQGQLTLAEALNRGDIAAAARAAVDVQNIDIQNALENQQAGLDEARKAEIAPLNASQEANTAAIETLTSKIETLNNKEFTVENIENAKDYQPETYSTQGNDFMGYLNYGLNAASDFAGPVGIVKNLFEFFQNPAGYIGLKAQQYMQPGTVVLQNGQIVPQTPALKPVTPYTGGYIKGPGTGTSDDIPAMLSNGEYVIRANAVKTIGVDTLHKLNQADRVGFAAGGMVNSFRKKPIKPKPKPYTLEDFKKPISKKDDPDWYDYTHNFFNKEGTIPILGDYKWNDAHQGFYRGQTPSRQRGVRDIVDFKDGKASFTSVAGTIKYYKALILSRRQAPKYIQQILADSSWTGYGDKQATARSNLINSRMFGNYNGLDKQEAKVLASAMSRLWGPDKVKEGFEALGLSPDLLTNKSMFKDWDAPSKKAWLQYTRNNENFIPPTLSPNTPKYANGGMVGKYANGGLVSAKMSVAEPIPKQFANGGMVPSYFADGGFVGPRPVPGWDDKGRWVVSRGESYWSIAEATLPEGMDIGSWWSKILKSNIDPETGKERRLYRNSRVWIPGRKQPYPPKQGMPILETIKKNKPRIFGTDISLRESHGGMGGGAIGGGLLGFGPKMYANGGMVPSYFAQGGFSMGTDTVPAMLTPGEFVIKKSAVDRIGPATLNKINGYAEGGLVGGMSTDTANSVYNNTYEVNVNVASMSNPNDIANAVMRQIKQVDNTRVRGLSR